MHTWNNSLLLHSVGNQCALKISQRPSAHAFTPEHAPWELQSLGCMAHQPYYTSRIPSRLLSSRPSFPESPVRWYGEAMPPSQRRDGPFLWWTLMSWWRTRCPPFTRHVLSGATYCQVPLWGGLHKSLLLTTAEHLERVTDTPPYRLLHCRVLWTGLSGAKGSVAVACKKKNIPCGRVAGYTCTERSLTRWWPAMSIDIIHNNMYALCTVI